MTFTDLNINEKIISALKEININEPSEIQAKLIPEILENNDIFVKSHYGNGKTGSFLLPIIDLLDQHTAGGIRCLILVPSSNYAHKIKLNLALYGKNTDLIYINLNDRRQYEENLEYLKSGVDILISTPNLLNDHILDDEINISSTKILVFDEADLFVELEQLDDLDNIIDNVGELDQTIIYSGSNNQDIDDLSQSIQKNVYEFNFLEEQNESQLIKENIYLTSGFHSKLDHLMEHINQEDYRNVIIFVQSYKNADEIYNRLRRIYNYKVAFLNKRKMNQKHKLFRLLLDGKVRILIICEDDLDKDINLHGVHQVINFDFNLTTDDYENRKYLLSGFNKQVRMITFVNEVEIEKLKDFESHFNKTFDKISLDQAGQFLPYQGQVDEAELGNENTEFGRKSKERNRRF
jgi:ATP-dependent RNA helicase RhlE